MGIVLNWTSVYTPVLGAAIDSFPVVSDGVHDVLASHVNSLATSLVAVETLQQSLASTVAGLDGSRIEDGDGDTFVDTDLAGGDSDIVTIAAPNGVRFTTNNPVRGVSTNFIFEGSADLTINSGAGTQAAADTNGSNIQIVANDGGDQSVSAGGSGGGVYLYAGEGGSGALAGQGGPISLTAGDGGDDDGTGFPAPGGTIDIFAGSAGVDLSGNGVNTGGTITITAGAGSGSALVPCGSGGAVVIIAGQGGYGYASNNVGNGGSVTIEGGPPGTNDGGLTGNGGSVIINGASATSEGDGGSVQISAGNAGGAAGVNGPGTAGDVNIQAGTGAPAVIATPGTAGGTVNIIGGAGGAGAGSAPPGFGGVVNIRGGDAGNVLSAGAPDGGNVAIRGGYGEGFSGLGGTIAIDGGDANGGTGNYGNVQIGALETTENITLLAQTDLTFQANGNIAPIPFNDGVDTDLVGFTSTSIVGALNELKASPGITDHGALSGLADDDHTQYILVNGSRAFTGQVLAVAGALASAPAYSFSGDTGTGLNRPSTGNIGISTSGTNRVTINSTSIAATVPFQSSANSSFRGTLGGSGTPTFTFTSDTDTGMYQYNSDIVGIACGGNASYRFANGTLTFNSNQLLTTTGTLSLTSTGAMTLDAGATDITFDARSMSTPITLNQSGNTDLVGFTATSIVGALNEVKEDANVVFSTEFSGSPPLIKTVDADDNHAFISFTSAAQVLCTSQSAGFRMFLRQAVSGTGSVEIYADTGVTLHYPATFSPATAEQNSVVMAWWITATDVVLIGDLEI